MDYGLLGGIAEGLQSGMNAYKDMSRYQQEQALKKRLANVQGAEAYAKLLGVGGSAVNPLVDKMGLISDVSPNSSSDQSQDQSAGQQNTAGLLIQGVPSEFDKAKMMKLFDEAASKNADSWKTGIKYTPDNTNFTLKSEQVPRSDLGQIEFDKANAEKRNAQLQPTYHAQEDYEKRTQNVNQVRDNYSKILHAFQKPPSPKQDLSMVINLVSMELPGQAIREGALAELEKNTQLSTQTRDAIHKYLTGTMDPSVRQDLVRTAGNVWDGLQPSLEGEQERATGMARERGVSTSFLNDPALAKVNALHKQVQSQIGAYQNPESQPGLLMKAAKGLGLMRGSTGNNAYAAPLPKLSDGDRAYLQKAIQDNPNDPRAPQIKQLLNLPR